jgi:Ca-activated chloride channel homolog
MDGCRGFVSRKLEMLEQFHFIRPLWLLALIPLALIAWRAYRPGGGDNPWSGIVDARLLPLLMAKRTSRMDRTALWLVAAGWIIAAVALANPAWERKPLPVYQTTAARVVVLDLSSAMTATDLKPSRLARARYKIEDVLASNNEGRTALVVYAGDAFTVSPLTRDANTIRALLKVLEPGIMPAEGSRADLGLLKGEELLRQAGASSGQVLLITGGVDSDNAAASERAAARLKDDGYRVDVLGVGAEAGGPLSNARGELVRDADGKIVDAHLETATLQSLARAGGGEYRSITDSGKALDDLLNDGRPSRAEAAVRTDATTQGWKEQGPLLAVLLLPLAALAFRRNWLLGVVLFVGIASPPRPAMASTWDDLWRRHDQQAAQALAAGDYAKASELATDPDRRGSAEYKRGDYLRALDDFAKSKGADADYNRGNALARLGRYREAIAAYDQSLKERPSEDARVNKAAVEALLKQQQPAHQRTSNSGQDASRKDQSQGNGGGQKPSPTQSQDATSQDGRNGQTGASSGQGREPKGAKEPGAGSQGAASQPEPGKGNAGREAAASKGDDQQPSGTDRANPGGGSGNASDQQEWARSGTAQQSRKGNQFAEAAKKLDEHSASARSAEGPPGRGATVAADQAQPTAGAKPHPQGGSAESAQPLDSEEQIAAEQWLRRIPDDPGGLLRRKFLYQYRQRAQHADAGVE